MAKEDRIELEKKKLLLAVVNKITDRASLSVNPVSRAVLFRMANEIIDEFSPCGEK